MRRLLCWLFGHKWADMKVTPFKAGDFLLINDCGVWSEPQREPYTETVCARCDQYRDRPDFAPVWRRRLD